MGMKVAAVSVMCQDERVFNAMMHAGTPCPYDGLIGPEAKAAWLAEGKSVESPAEEAGIDEKTKDTAVASGGIAGLLALILLL